MHPPAGYPGRDEGVVPDVFPACLVSRRTRPSVALMSPHSTHPGHTFRCVLFLPFFCPVPALLLVCRHLCSSRNGTGHHSAESLTDSMRQPSWRVMHGSVRCPGRQRFHSDDTVAGIRSIFPLTRGQVIRSPRCRALSAG